MKVFSSCLNSLQRNELATYLIKEELRSRKFFNALRELGLDDSFYQADHWRFILSLVGLEAESWDTDDFYYNIMEQHSSEVEANEQSLTRHAFAVCEKLMAWKHRS